MWFAGQRSRAQALHARAAFSVPPAASATSVETNQSDRCIEILKRGVEAWNRWREENPDERPDLTGVDFANPSIWRGTKVWGSPPETTYPERVVFAPYEDTGGRKVGINFSRAILTRANFTRVYMQHADLREARATDTIFVSADLESAIFDDAVLSQANFENAELFGASFEDAWADNTSFQRAKLEEAAFKDAHISGANFSAARLRSARFTDAYASDANFSGADMVDARLDGMQAWDAKFSGATMSGAVLMHGDFHRALFQAAEGRKAAVLSGVSFREADLSRCNIIECDLSQSQWAFAKCSDIVYEFKHGQCAGVGGIRDIYGNLRFREALQEQEFKDSKWAELDSPPSDISNSYARTIGAGLCIAVVFCFVQFVALESAQEVPQAGRWDLDAVLAIFLQYAFTFVVGISLGVSGATVFVRRWLLRLWRLFNYGRSIPALVLFAFLSIGVIGGLYCTFDGTHVVLPLPDETCRALGGERDGVNCLNLEEKFKINRDPSYPWFVAVMGFCTLGVTDLVFPKTGWGEFIIMANVALGFITFGLMLALLADRFAHRQ